MMAWSFVLLFVVQHCSAHPVDWSHAGNEETWGPVLASACLLLACSAMALLGCVCCRHNKTPAFQEFTDTTSSHSLSTAGFVNPLAGVATPASASTEFTIFPPPGVTPSTTVLFEPLPDIRPTAPPSAPLRPASFNHNLRAQLSEGVGFPRDRLSYLQEVGTGWFGKVVEGEALVDGARERVVVKILHEGATSADQALFLQEVAHLRTRHAHVLRMLGVCLEAQPLLAILELCPQGDLKHFLLQHREDAVSLALRGDVERIMRELAAGLQHLHSEGFVHTDLAARNCLMDTQHSIKIGDYGTSIDTFREEYYCVDDVALPIRWCAPETLECTDVTIHTRQVTANANMWSLGVVLWEVMQFGQLPYAELSDEEVLVQVLGPTRRVPHAPSSGLPRSNFLYQVMRSCWGPQQERPTAAQVHAMLLRPQADESFEQRWSALTPSTSVQSHRHKSPSLQNLHGSLEDLPEVKASSLPSSRENLASPQLSEFRGHVEVRGHVDVEIHAEDQDHSEIKDHDFAMNYFSVNNHLEITGHDEVRGHCEVKLDLEYGPEVKVEDICLEIEDEDARQINAAIQDLDDALAMERTSSSEHSSAQSTPRSSHAHDVRRKQERRALDVRLDSDSEEEFTWTRRVERGELTEKVRQKSKSVQDLMILTHIESSEHSSDDDAPRTLLAESFKSEGNICGAVVIEGLLDSFRQLQKSKIDEDVNISESFSSQFLTPNSYLNHSNTQAVLPDNNLLNCRDSCGAATSIESPITVEYTSDANSLNCRDSSGVKTSTGSPVTTPLKTENTGDDVTYNICDEDASFDVSPEPNVVRHFDTKPIVKSHVFESHNVPSTDTASLQSNMLTTSSSVCEPSRSSTSNIICDPILSHGTQASMESNSSDSSPMYVDMELRREASAFVAEILECAALQAESQRWQAKRKLESDIVQLRLDSSPFVDEIIECALMQVQSRRNDISDGGLEADLRRDAEPFINDIIECALLQTESRRNHGLLTDTLTQTESMRSDDGLLKNMENELESRKPDDGLLSQTITKNESSIVGGLLKQTESRSPDVENLTFNKSDKHDDGLPKQNESRRHDDGLLSEMVMTDSNCTDDSQHSDIPDAHTVEIEAASRHTQMQDLITIEAVHDLIEAVQDGITIDQSEIIIPLTVSCQSQAEAPRCEVDSLSIEQSVKQRDVTAGDSGISLEPCSESLAEEQSVKQRDVTTGDSGISLEPCSDRLAVEQSVKERDVTTGDSGLSLEPCSDSIAVEQPVKKRDVTAGDSGLSLEPCSDSIAVEQPVKKRDVTAGDSGLSLEPCSDSIAVEQPVKKRDVTAGDSELSLEPCSDSLAVEQSVKQRDVTAGDSGISLEPCSDDSVSVEHPDEHHGVLEEQRVSRTASEESKVKEMDQNASKAVVLGVIKDIIITAEPADSPADSVQESVENHTTTTDCKEQKSLLQLPIKSKHVVVSKESVSMIAFESMHPKHGEHRLRKVREKDLEFSKFKGHTALHPEPVGMIAFAAIASKSMSAPVTAPLDKPNLDVPAPISDIPSHRSDLPASVTDVPAPISDIPAPNEDHSALILDVPAPILDKALVNLDIPAPILDKALVNLDIPVSNLDTPATNSDIPASVSPPVGEQVSEEFCTIAFEYVSSSDVIESDLSPLDSNEITEVSTAASTPNLESVIEVGKVFKPKRLEQLCEEALDVVEPHRLEQARVEVDSTNLAQEICQQNSSAMSRLDQLIRDPSSDTWKLQDSSKLDSSDEHRSEAWILKDSSKLDSNREINTESWRLQDSSKLDSNCELRSESCLLPDPNKLDSNSVLRSESWELQNSKKQNQLDLTKELNSESWKLKNQLDSNCEVPNKSFSLQDYSQLNSNCEIPDKSYILQDSRQLDSNCEVRSESCKHMNSDKFDSNSGIQTQSFRLHESSRSDSNYELKSQFLKLEDSSRLDSNCELPNKSCIQQDSRLVESNCEVESQSFRLHDLSHLNSNFELPNKSCRLQDFNCEVRSESWSRQDSGKSDEKRVTPDDERSSDSGFRDKGSLSDDPGDKYNLEDIEGELETFAQTPSSDSGLERTPHDDLRTFESRDDDEFWTQQMASLQQAAGQTLALFQEAADLSPCEEERAYEDSWLRGGTEDGSYVSFNLDDVAAIRCELQQKLPRPDRGANDGEQKREDVTIHYNIYPAPLSPILEEQESLDSSICSPIHSPGQDKRNSLSSSEPDSPRVSSPVEFTTLQQLENNPALEKCRSSPVHESTVDRCNSPRVQPSVESARLHQLEEDNPVLEQCRSTPVHESTVDTCNSPRVPSPIESMQSRLHQFEEDIRSELEQDASRSVQESTEVNPNSPEYRSPLESPKERPQEFETDIRRALQQESPMQIHESTTVRSNSPRVLMPLESPRERSEQFEADIRAALEQCSAQQSSAQQSSAQRDSPDEDVLYVDTETNEAAIIESPLRGKLPYLAFVNGQKVFTGSGERWVEQDGGWKQAYLEQFDAVTSFSEPDPEESAAWMSVPSTRAPMPSPEEEQARRVGEGEAPPCNTPEWESEPPSWQGKPEWESDTASEGSSSSGEFVWREGERDTELKMEDSKDDGPLPVTSPCKLLSSEFPMSVIEEEDEDSSDTEFVPSSWNSEAAPSRSSLRSPDKKQDPKKNVSFKREKYHCVYEYPREASDTEAEELDARAPIAPAAAPPLDYASYADWEMLDDEIVEQTDQDTDPDSSEHLKPEPFDFYKLSSIECDFNHGLAEEGEFFISSSARPFHSEFSSQFFPGLASVSPGGSSSSATPPSPLSPTMGELRHTRDRLKLDLPKFALLKPKPPITDESHA